MNTALLIVDLQNDYFPEGKMELRGSLEASHQARRLLEHFRRAELPVVFIQHVSTRPGATFFLPGTPGMEIHANVQPLAGETVVQKNYPNSFRGTDLHPRLQSLGVKRLVVAGMMTHMCVDASVRAATDLGYECLTAGDACATRDLAFQGQVIPAAQVHAAFLAALNGAYGQVQLVEELLQRLEGEAG